MIRKWITVLATHAILCAIFAFFYVSFVVPKKAKVDIKIYDVREEATFDLSANQSYLLKLWGQDVPRAAYFNSHPIYYSFLRSRPLVKEFYYRIPKEVVKIGKNIFTISSDSPLCMRLKNNLAYSQFGGIFFNDAGPLSLGTRQSPAFVFFVSLFLSLFAWVVFFYFLKKFFALSLDNFLVIYALSFAPWYLFLFFLHIVSRNLPIRFVFFNSSYIGMTIAMVSILLIPCFFFILAKKVAGLVSSLQKSLSLKPPSDKPPFDALAGWKDYRMIRWWFFADLSDRLLAIFIFLLFFCAFLLSFHAYPIADFFANVAYIVLLVSVIRKIYFLHNTKSGLDEPLPKK
jgi:hypothetical protein